MSRCLHRDIEKISSSRQSQRHLRRCHVTLEGSVRPILLFIRFISGGGTFNWLRRTSRKSTYLKVRIFARIKKRKAGTDVAAHLILRLGGYRRDWPGAVLQ